MIDRAEAARDLQSALRMPPLTPPPCENRHAFQLVGCREGAHSYRCTKCGATLRAEDCNLGASRNGRGRSGDGSSAGSVPDPERQRPQGKREAGAAPGPVDGSGRVERPGRQTWPVEPGMGRVAYGLAYRVDRLKALGNGQVPRVAATAFDALSRKIAP